MTAAKKDLRSDLQADLLVDLAGPVVDEPLAPAVEPAPAPPDLTEATPALSFALTPLKWSRPRITTVRGGLGKGLRLGPVKVELSVKE
jgi:hypothetical protein